MSGLSKFQLEANALYKFRPRYKEKLSQYLSQGYMIAYENLFMIVLQKVKKIPTDKKEFHIELDGLICDDDKAQDKLEKLLVALWGTCITFKDDGVEIHKLSTPGVKDDEHNSK